MKISIINGPNLNMLGVREPSIYGNITLDGVNDGLKEFVSSNGLNIELDFFQSNLEGEIVDKIQECLGESDGIIINPAAYSHTSIAIQDAIAGVNLPTIEVHISNVYRREPMRQKMITAMTATAVISGLGTFSYHTALVGMHQILIEKESIENNKENN